ncbi:MAG: NifB/NifX family molybdenum-iron cluster-binding protein [Proteobacteria bacterium]|nr:NifB/NifX family molybdenum-iron cluster-binding protein [Pseudomonadota bacterium]MBU1233002.1 NifB/NifX family molybdenum-iron cluster-binding protein [Pseudomonadota bacterium]MBU1418676.1 NifB/NifX family molybdenum-iron cluster-binding protein [Pseudomonadota bacterium]MBU1454422.1 NifB/NifX family molybdenum-iron cluster-binding protein [Pseudomonadota bacterium]
MKIAITAKGTDFTSEVDPRFGRAAYILMVDTETFDLEVIDNSINSNAFKGAGIQAATTVCDKGAKVLLTGYCGPKAFAVVDAAGIKVVSDVEGNVKDVVESFISGNLTYTDSANAFAHW